MKDYNSPQEVAKRANQEDPIIMYLIVRESLLDSMSRGKIGAQCAHASQMLLLQWHEFAMADLKSSYYGLPPFSREVYELFQEWLDGSFRKVVLKADDKEWEKVKTMVPLKNRVVVIDAGLTDVEPGSETVIGLCPMRKSTVPKIVKRLQLLI